MHLSFRRFLIGGWLLLPSASPSPATEPCTLTVTSGPVAYQVFQRCERNVADLSFEGTSDFHRPAIVQACVINMLTFLTVQDWQPLGALTDGYWQGALKNVPAGGPYRIEIRLLDAEKNIRATASIEHLLVGDLWILAGQSNMQGAGELVDVELPSLLVHSYGMNERWSIAAEPLHWLMDSIDPVHHPGLDGERLRRDGESQKKSAVAGAGCGLPFAKELVKTTGVPIGLIPCAHGGTSMTQWDPDKKNEAGHSLYGSMLRRFHAVGGKVKGLLWYQGESDANRGDAPQFHDRFSRFIEAVRRDFNAPELPVYFAQISRIVTKDAFPYWDDIREQQRLCAAEIPHCGMVSTLDLPLDDPVHISTPGHKRLGKRFARLVLQHVYGKTEWTHGPTLDYILPLPSRFKRYQVHFKGVNRKLVAVDRPSGFSLRDQNESDLGLLYKTLISSDGKSIDLFLYDQPPPGSCLWYGYGLDPYCNITDAEDMALAAFGPIPLDHLMYTTFLELLHKEPANPDLSILLPHVLVICEKNPVQEKEITFVVKKQLKCLSAENQMVFSPLLFRSGDFSNWDEWLANAREAPLQERKRMALSFQGRVDSPFLKAKPVKTWYFVGGFDNTGCVGFDRVYAPENDCRLGQTYVLAKGDTLRWVSAEVDTDKVLNLGNLIGRRDYVVAYAQTTIEAKQAAEIPMLFGSDDAAVIWLNGTEIHREHVHRPVKESSDLVFSRFQRGKNTILVKVGQRTGDWGLCMRLLDQNNLLSVP